MVRSNWIISRGSGEHKTVFFSSHQLVMLAILYETLPCNKMHHRPLWHSIPIKHGQHVQLMYTFRDLHHPPNLCFPTFSIIFLRPILASHYVLGFPDSFLADSLWHPDWQRLWSRVPALIVPSRHNLRRCRFCVFADGGTCCWCLLGMFNSIEFLWGNGNRNPRNLYIHWFIGDIWMVLSDSLWVGGEGL